MKTRYITISVGLLMAWLLNGCAAYQSHVAARQTSLSGYAKNDNFGGKIIHRVEYR